MIKIKQKTIISDDLASLYYKNEAAYFEQFFRLSQTSKKNKKKSTSYPVKRSISKI